MAPLLTQRQAAELFGVTIRTLERMRTDGDGPPYVKFGHAVRYDPTEVERWLAGRRRTSTSDPGPRQPADTRPAA